VVSHTENLIRKTGTEKRFFLFSGWPVPDPGRRMKPFKLPGNGRGGKSKLPMGKDDPKVHKKFAKKGLRARRIPGVDQRSQLGAGKRS